MNTANEVLQRINAIRVSLALSRLNLSVESDLADLERTFTQDHWMPIRLLMGVRELSELMSVGRSTITGWAYSPATRFPDPVLRVGGGPLWDALDVVAWWKAWTPIKGRKAGVMPNIGDLVGV